VPMRLREEVQEMLRRGGDKLTRTPDSSNGSAPTARCDNCCARGFGHEEQAGYKGYVIEARSCELKDGGYSAEFSVEEHDASGVTETQFYLPQHLFNAGVRYRGRNSSRAAEDRRGF
jgi:hypothetical protein